MDIAELVGLTTMQIEVAIRTMSDEDLRALHDAEIATPDPTRRSVLQNIEREFRKRAVSDQGV